MLTQKCRSESDLVIWLLFGFEEVIVQVTDRSFIGFMNLHLVWCVPMYTDKTVSKSLLTRLDPSWYRLLYSNA